MIYGTLYIVSTSIGNLEDMTLRALRILKEVDLIASEDTRITRQLLSHYDIHTPLTSYNEHNKIFKGNYLLGLLKHGKNIALTSSRGTPLISDPGYPLVRDAIKDGIDVRPIPGASAVISALVVSGMPADRFLFLGFLPRKEGKIKDALRRAMSCGRTVILYESPFRVIRTLRTISETCGNVKVVLAREMTKKFEEIIRGDVVEVLEKLGERDIKGEVTLLLHNPAPEEADD